MKPNPYRCERRLHYYAHTWGDFPQADPFLAYLNAGYR